MKSFSEGADQFTCDDLPIPVIIHRQSDGHILKYNKEARKLFGFPVKPSGVFNIQKIRPYAFSTPRSKKTTQFAAHGVAEHRTLKGKKLSLSVSQKFLKWKGEKCLADFYEDAEKINLLKQEIIKTSIDAFISTDEDQKIIDWNTAAESVFGWKRKEVLGRKLATIIIPKQHRKQHNEGFTRYFKSGEGNVVGKLIEITGQDKKGNEFPIELAINVGHEQGKRIFYSFIRDISGRKKNEKALLESEANLKRAQSIASIGSWEMSGRFQEIFWSDEFYHIHGLEPQSVRPSTRLRLSMVHPQDRAKLETAIDQATRKGKPYSLEKRIIRPTGEVRWILSQGEAKIDPVTGRRKVFGTLLDITERKRVEEQQLKLHKSLADFQNAVENSSIVSRTDANGVIHYVNDKFVKISGYTAEELIGANYRILNSGHHPKSFWMDMWKTISSGKFWREEVKNRAKDGSYFWVDTFVMPFLDERGKVKEFLTIRNDITSRKRSEEELASSNASLSEAFIFGKMGSCELNIATAELHVSKEFFKMLEVDSEPKNVPLHEFLEAYVHPDFLDAVKDRISKGIGDGSNAKRVVHLEFQMVTANGKNIWIDGKGIFKGQTALGIFQDITEQKKTEEVLRQNKRKYRLLYNNVPSMYFTIDRSLNVTLVNDLGASQLGYHPAELTGNSVLKVFPSALHETVTQQVKQCFANPKRIFEWEIQKVKKDGTLIFVYEKAWVESSLTGESLLNIICEDITKRKVAEQEVIKQKELSNNIINSVPGVLYLFDESGKFLRWNKNFETVTGYSAQEITCMHALDFFEGDDKLEAEDRIREVFESGQTEAINCFFTKYKTKVPYHFNAWLIDYEGKRCLIGTGIDITLQLKTEEDVARKANLIETMLNSATDSIFALDNNLNFNLVNPVFAAFRGLPIEEMLGKNMIELFPHVKGTTFEATIIQALHSQEAVTFEHRNTKNSQQVFQISVYPNSEGLFVYAKDITAGKEMELKLRESELKFRQIVANMGEGMLFYNHNSEVFSANDEACKLFEMTEKEIRLAGREGVVDMDSDSYHYMLETVKKTGAFKGELWLKKKSGARFLAEVTYKNFNTPGTKDKNSVIIIHDITERKEAEREATKKNTMIRVMLDGITDSFFAMDRDLNITLVNSVFESVTKMKAEQMVGKNLLELFPILLNSELVKVYQTAIRLNQAMTYEQRNPSNPEQVYFVNVYPNPDGLFIFFSDISQQKQMEEAIAASEQRLKLILKGLPVAVYLTNNEGYITDFNDAAVNLWGRQPELLKEQWCGSSRLYDREGASIKHSECPMAVSIKEKRAIVGEEAMLSKPDGTMIHFMAYATPFISSSGRMEGAMNVMVDITGQKNTEETLAASEQRYRSILEQFPLAVVTYDPSGLISSANRKWEILWDTKFDSAVGYNVLEDKSTEIKGVSNYIEKAFAGEVIETPVVLYEPALIGRAGRNRWIKVLFFPLRNKEGKIFEIIEVIQDLTEIKVAEEEIRESEERFRTMADSAPVLIWLSGTDKLCYYFNKVWYDFTGRTIEQEMGNGWAEGVHPDDLDGCISTYTKCFDQRQEFRMEYRLRRHDGEYRWVVDNGRPRFLPGGEFVGYIGSCIDITERKNAEREIQEREVYLRGILDSTHDGILAVDDRGKIIKTSNRFEELWQIPKSILELGEDKALIDHVIDQLEDPDAFIAKVKSLYNSNDTSFDLLSFKDGRIFERYSTPLLLNKMSVGRVWSFRDITKQKRAERELEISHKEISESEAKLNAFFHSTTDIIVLLDRESRVVAFNQAAAKAAIEWYGREFLVGELYSDYAVHSTTLNLVDRSLKGEVLGDEVELRFPKGQQIWFKRQYRPMLDGEGRIIGIAITLTNIDEERRATQKIKALADNIPDGFIYEFESNREGSDYRFTYASNGLANLFEMSQEDFISSASNMFAKVHSEDSDRMHSLFLKSLNDLSIFEADYRVTVPSGKLKWVKSKAKPTLQSDGTVLYEGISIDITQQKLQAEEIQMKSEQLATISENIPMGTVYQVLIKPTGERVFTFIGTGVERITGFSADEVMKDSSVLYNQHHEADQEKIFTLENESMEQMKVFEAEFRFWHKNGTLLWLHTRSRPRQTSEGILFDGFLSDVTNRRNAEIALKQNEERFKLLYNQTPVMMHSIDAEGKLIRVSDFWLEKMEYTREEVIGKPSIGFLTEESRARAAKIIPGFIKTGKAFTTEFDYITKNGKVLNTLLSASSEKDENGKFAQSMTVVTDITETKRLAKRLELANKAAGLGVWQMDFVNNGCECDEKFKEIFGLGDTPYSKELFWSMLHPEDAESKKLRDSQLLQSFSTYYQDEYRIVRPNDREIRYIKSQGIFFRDTEGKPVTGISVIYDQTAEKLAEQAVIESKRRLEVITDSLPSVAIYQYEVAAGEWEGHYTYYSSGVEQITGLTAEELLKDPSLFEKRIHPQDWFQKQIKIEEANKRLSEFNQEYRFKHKDGSWRWLRTRSNPTKLEEGVIVWNGLIIDITEAKESERNLVFTRFTIDHTSDPVFWIRPDATIADINPAAHETLGYTYEEMMFMSVADIDAEFTKEGWQRNWKMLREKKTSTALRKLKRKEGSLMDVEIVSNYIEFEGQSFNCAFVRNITERKKAQDEILKTSRLYALTSQINDMVVHVKNKQEVFSEACRIAVDYGQFRMAWFGLVDEEMKFVTPVSWYGYEDGYIDFFSKTMMQHKSGAGPTGKSALLKDAVINNDIADEENHSYDLWREEALRRGYRSSIGLPIIVNDELLGVFNLYQSEAFFFNKKEVELLETIASNIAFSLGTLENEKVRRQKEEELAESEERLRSIIDNEPNCIKIMNSKGELLEMNASGLALIEADNLQSVARRKVVDIVDTPFKTPFNELAKTVIRGGSGKLEFSVTGLKGTRRWLETYAVPLKDPKTKENLLLGITRDVTVERQAQQDLLLTKNRLELAAQAAGLGIWDADYQTGKIIWDQGMASIYGVEFNEHAYSKEEWSKFIHIDDLSNLNSEVTALIEGSASVYKTSFRIIRKDNGEIRHIETLGIIDRDPSGKVLRMTGVNLDRTNERIYEQQLLEGITEKENLIKEIHHRVKNNLQLISSILYIRLSNMNDEHIKSFIEDTRQKIKAIALIHERLLQTGSVDQVDAYDYLGRLVTDLQMSNSNQTMDIQILSDIEPESMKLDTAIYCGLIINELVTNATKHAFANRSKGIVSIKLSKQQDKHVLIVSNNGNPLPEKVVLGNGNSFGMQMLDIFIKQLKGTCTIERENGTTFTVEF